MLGNILRLRLLLVGSGWGWLVDVNCEYAVC